MPRLKAAAEVPAAYYHCISRVVDRRFIFGPQEKDHFVKLMRLYESFCGLHVLTYVVMSNHFHILVEVPKRPESMPAPEVLLDRIEALHSPLYATNIRDLLASMTPTAAEAHLNGYWRRMHDVSWFIRMVKQRFSQWYNVRKGRCGTLWEQRFKSVLVEGKGPVLAAMGAYIDLNPVRVGLVKDPKDYRWSGYGEAIAGKPNAREGIRLIMKGLENRKWEGILEGYRVFIHGEADPVHGHGGIPSERVREVIRSKGSLPLAEFLRCRVRYFEDGVAIGSQGYVENIFQDQRWRFGKRRKTGARAVRWLDGLELFTLRNLIKRALNGSPESEGADTIQGS